MNKNFKAVIFFCCLLMMTKQFAMFRASTVLSRSINSDFAENFLRKIYKNKALVKTVQIFSQQLLSKSIENELFLLRCEDGVDVKVAVTPLVAKMQKNMFQDLKDNGASVVQLPEEYNLLSWQPIYNEYGIWEGRIDFVKEANTSFAQVALVSYLTENSRVAIFGKNNNSNAVLSECLSTKEDIDALEEQFSSFFKLEHNKKK